MLACSLCVAAFLVMIGCKALAGEFIGLGVTFERPITNSQMLWEVSLGPQ